MRRIAKKRVLEAAALGAAALAALNGSAFAQGAPFSRGDPPCVLDKCLQGGAGLPAPDRQDRTTPAPSGPDQDTFNTPVRRGPTAPGNFDFYVLALSWSPGFCETGGADKGYKQCEPGSGLGFVVHGLWPQNTRGYPSNCDSSAGGPSRMALDSARGLYPDEGLARHEWRAHGTCTGLSPTDYFADVRRARAAITIPNAFRAPGDPQTIRPLDIARAFADANPRLRTDSVAVACRGNTLTEVRICLSKDLRGTVPCPEVARASCRRPVEVPPVM